jgi:hypothetical protein
MESVKDLTEAAGEAARNAYKDGGRGEECAEAAAPYIRAQALRDAADRWCETFPGAPSHWAVERVLREWAAEEAQS